MTLVHKNFLGPESPVLVSCIADMGCVRGKVPQKAVYAVKFAYIEKRERTTKMEQEHGYDAHLLFPVIITAINKHQEETMDNMLGILKAWSSLNPRYSRLPARNWNKK